MSSDSASSDSPLSSDSEFSKPEAEPVCSAYILPPREKVKIDFTLPLDIGKLDKRGGQIKEDGSYITDANATDGGGALAVAHNGDLSVCDVINEGTELTLEYQHTDRGEVLTFSISDNPELFLALDRFNKYYAVRGMTDTEMHHTSDRYWKKVPFKDIGECPVGSGYFALQYWGDAFGTPTHQNYYFIIDNKKIFRVAPVEEAAEHGRLGLVQL